MGGTLASDMLLDDMKRVSSSVEEDLVAMLKSTIRGVQVSGISKIFFNNTDGSCVWNNQDHTQTVANIAIPLLVWKVCQVKFIWNGLNVISA